MKKKEKLVVFVFSILAGWGAAFGFVSGVAAQTSTLNQLVLILSAIATAIMGHVVAIIASRRLPND